MGNNEHLQMDLTQDPETGFVTALPRRFYMDGSRFRIGLYDGHGGDIVDGAGHLIRSGTNLIGIFGSDGKPMATFTDHRTRLIAVNDSGFLGIILENPGRTPDSIEYRPEGAVYRFGMLDFIDASVVGL